MEGTAENGEIVWFDEMNFLFFFFIGNHRIFWLEHRKQKDRVCYSYVK